MGTIVLLSSIFIVVSLVGFLLAYLYGRKTTQFRWREYLAMIGAPLLFILYLIFYFDRRILLIFLVSATIGFVAEWTVSYVYEKVLGKKLWTYNQLSINGHTSILSIPLWGIAGVVFWFISKLVGL